MSWEEIISFACKLFPQIYFKSHQNFHKYFCYLLTNKKNTIKFCRYAIQDKLVMDQLNKKKETKEKIPLSWEEIISFASKLFPQIDLKSSENSHKYFCYQASHTKNKIFICFACFYLFCFNAIKETVLYSF